MLFVQYNPLSHRYLLLLLFLLLVGLPFAVFRLKTKIKRIYHTVWCFFRFVRHATQVIITPQFCTYYFCYGRIFYLKWRSFLDGGMRIVSEPRTSTVFLRINRTGVGKSLVCNILSSCRFVRFHTIYFNPSVNVYKRY